MENPVFEVHHSTKSESPISEESSAAIKVITDFDQYEKQESGENSDQRSIYRSRADVVNKSLLRSIRKFWKAAIEDVDTGNVQE